MTNLKPCPFCGGEGVAFKFGVIEEFGVRCNNCGAQTDDIFDSYAAAEEAWNTRYKRTCKREIVEGTSIRYVVCSECRSIIDPYDLFCKRCGAEIINEP